MKKKIGKKNWIKIEKNLEKKIGKKLGKKSRRYFFRFSDIFLESFYFLGFLDKSNDKIR